MHCFASLNMFCYLENKTLYDTIQKMNMLHLICTIHEWTNCEQGFH